jgi:hypothetical protein
MQWKTLLCIAEKCLYFKVHLCISCLRASLSLLLMGANNLYSSRSMVLISDHQVCNPPPLPTPPPMVQWITTEHQIQCELTTSKLVLIPAINLWSWGGGGGGGELRVRCELNSFLFLVFNIFIWELFPVNQGKNVKEVYQPWQASKKEYSGAWGKLILKPED